MKQQPLLTTDRLILRPFQLSDALTVQKLAGDPNIANGTINVPHPYGDGMAGQWIGKHVAGWQSQVSAIYAITLKSSHQVVGCVGLHNIDGEQAQLGYWIGVPFWGNGYCTEAAHRLLHFGFDKLHLKAVSSRHLSREEAAGKVLRKIGMKHIRRENDALKVNRITEDLEYYAVTANELTAIPH
ncbi:acetyltransferase [Photobacterium jeanii]|uniref:Acetyltransferase n=1 Tax=Photobacterium jeanii TaxID=858640 RepID=A0A178K1N9_9GAMM|nr:GNAT family N-acetyltransferase [Photobacterium jeanii]OAN11249.1 acetyltransferase [Photobacterium jeanii]PST90769.1 N-acetyltransferase [Photobacterium jeanii]